MVFSVTSSIFFKKISEFCSAEHSPDFFHDERIIDTQIWLPEMTPLANYMYLITPEELQRMRHRFRNCLLICAGSYDIEKYPPERSNDVIICPDTPDICRLANVIFTIFDQFRNWRNALNSILLTTESFHDIFMASRELLHMEFLLFNSRYEVLAVSDAFFGHFQEDLRQAAGSFVRELEADEEHILADHFTDKQIYELPSDSSARRMYAYNIFFHDAHSATLIAVWPQKEHEEGDIQFLYYTGAMIADFYAGYYSRIDRSNAESRLVGLLHAFSRGDLSGADQASDILYSFGWLTYHTYLAIEFTFLRRKDIGFSADYFCSRIEQTFGNCIAFPDEDTVRCVLNVSLTPEADFLEQLPYFLRDNLCHAGISNPCRNIFTLHTCFSQARQALMLGRQTDPHFWYFRFSDYTFQYLLMQDAREYEASQVIHPALAILREHDREKHTDYYHTLRYYLENNMNASRTAAKLFIHRSTFLQRLEQIEKITKIDLQNMRERTFLQLSFILDEENR